MKCAALDLATTYTSKGNNPSVGATVAILLSCIATQVRESILKAAVVSGLASWRALALQGTSGAFSWSQLAEAVRS